MHHAVYRVLYPFFDRKFINDSYSCRLWKGTHRAMNVFRGYAYRVSENHTKTLWVLKCDIKKLFANIYMNEFDQFAKHRLKTRYYIRYSDDFVILSTDREWLVSLLPRIRDFLHENLKLELHPNKVSVSTLASGVDFLGWVHFPDHRILRTSTKRRMLKAVRANPPEETLASYRGMLRHGNAYTLS